MRKLALPVVSTQVAGLWKDWVASYFATLTARNKRVLLVLYWSIWFSRNKVVHEGIHTSADESMTFVEAYIREQDTLGRMLPNAIPVRESYWQAPSESEIKFNFDSVFNSRSGSATTGVIGQNNRGMIMAACSFPHRDVVDAFAAEAYACKQAVLLAKDLGFLRAIIEGDSLKLIKKLISDRADRSIIYLIVHKIKILAWSFTSISFCFVRREANNAAHVLARECRGYLVPRYWMEEAPGAATMASELDRRRLPEPHIQPIHHNHQMYEVTEELNDEKFCSDCRLVLNCPTPSYFCKTCRDFYLHETCANLRYEIRHPFHFAHPLYLYTSYHPVVGQKSLHCDFKLDVKCSTLTAHKTAVSRGKEMDIVTELNHFSHNHRLVLCYCNDPIQKTKCTMCELPILGPAYVCPKSCDYILHESCLKLPKKIRVPFHSEHVFCLGEVKVTQLLQGEDSNPQCYGCSLSLKWSWWAYNCESCLLNLHPLCAISLRHPSPSVLLAALRAVGNMFSKDDLHALALPCLLNLLKNNYKKSIKEEACWIISYITKGNHDHIQVTSGRVHLVGLMIKSSCIKPRCDLLNCTEPTTVSFCLKGNILEAGETDEIKGVNPCLCTHDR
ncbi:hypothetical protein GQ457_06G021420 [Hibiscus cannabinus]